jgi:hypothetical protein
MALWLDGVGLLRYPVMTEQMQGKLPGNAGLPARNTDTTGTRDSPKVLFASDDLQRELHLNPEDILELCENADLATHDMMDPSMPFVIEIPKVGICLCSLHPWPGLRNLSLVRLPSRHRWLAFPAVR